MISVFPFQTEYAFWQQAKEDVILSIKQTLDRYPTCRIGLAGGSTPKKLYEMLAEADLPWDQIQWILIDERYVPSDHPESNLRMIRKALFTPAPIPPDNIIHFDTSLPQESAAKDMSRKLINLTNERFPLFDLLILGAGGDGHIASLFEKDSALQSSYYASTAYADGYETTQRLTISILGLKKSAAAMLLLKGESKAPVLESLQGEGSLPLTALRELDEEMPIKVLTFGLDGVS